MFRNSVKKLDAVGIDKKAEDGRAPSLVLPKRSAPVDEDDDDFLSDVAVPFKVLVKSPNTEPPPAKRPKTDWSDPASSCEVPCNSGDARSRSRSLPKVAPGSHAKSTRRNAKTEKESVEANHRTGLG